MRATQFIPEQYKLAINRGYGNKDIASGIPRPFSTTVEVQKEISRLIGYPKDSVTYDNTPLSGYHIMVDEHKNVQVFHPDGYSIDLTMYNIGIILRECQINQGIIGDELIFVFDKSYREYILVPFNRDTYEEVKKQSDEFFAAKTGTTELTYGCCVDFNGTKFVYLGKYWVSRIGKNGMNIVERYFLKRHFDTKKTQYYMLATRKPDAITDEHLTNYPEEKDLLNEVQKSDLREISSFYKSGSYNERSVTFDSLYISTDKPTKKDFTFDYSIFNGNGYGCTLDNLPTFLSDDGNVYAAMSTYGGSLAYSLSTYDIGAVTKAVPFDVSTLTPTIDRDSNGRWQNITHQRIRKIVLPKLVKK